MLIMNDNHRLRAGVASLDEPCTYCAKPLNEYPVILSDHVEQTVYHVGCAIELATDIIVDLDTFFRPPPPYARLFVLTAPQADPQPEGGTHAVNEYQRNQGGSVGASFHRWDTGELSNGAGGSNQEGATASDDS